MVHLQVSIPTHVGAADTLHAVREMVPDESQVESIEGIGIFIRDVQVAQLHRMRRVLNQLNISVVKVDAIPAHTAEQEELA